MGAPVSLFAYEGVVVHLGGERVLDGVDAVVPDGVLTCLVGPSGSGKSTLLRLGNRLVAPSGGVVRFRSDDVASIDPLRLRRRVGMVFQRPTPFPTMSIKDNVAAGLRLKLTSRPSRKATDETVESALIRAGLWNEVKDRLRESATALSGGQQQRLCIARALAPKPEVLLLDEPTASLDPLSTQTIEELVYELRKSIAVVIVTHNMQQAARVSDRTAFMLAGELIEFDATDTIFTRPRDSRTESYVTGRFG